MGKYVTFLLVQVIYSKIDYIIAMFGVLLHEIYSVLLQFNIQVCGADFHCFFIIFYLESNHTFHQG